MPIYAEEIVVEKAVVSPKNENEVGNTELLKNRALQNAIEIALLKFSNRTSSSGNSEYRDIDKKIFITDPISNGSNQQIDDYYRLQQLQTNAKVRLIEILSEGYSGADYHVEVKLSILEEPDDLGLVTAGHLWEKAGRPSIGLKMFTLSDTHQEVFSKSVYSLIKKSFLDNGISITENVDSEYLISVNLQMNTQELTEYETFKTHCELVSDIVDVNASNSIYINSQKNGPIAGFSQDQSQKSCISELVPTAAKSLIKGIATQMANNREQGLGFKIIINALNGDWVSETLEAIKSTFHISDYYNMHYLENTLSLETQYKGNAQLLIESLEENFDNTSCNLSLSSSIKNTISFKCVSAVEITNKNEELVQSALEAADLERGAVAIENTDKRILAGAYYALLIGVETYADESLNNLSHPLDDVDKIEKVLKTHYTFDQERIIILKNPIRNDIIDELDRLSRKLSQDDNLLIFFAGHGKWDEEIRQGYWFPSDAHNKWRSAWIPNSVIVDYINGINTNHTLLISDACFSGGIFKTREVIGINNIATKTLYSKPSRKAMTSGALTTVPDRSVFLKYLTDRLEVNRKQYISAEELFSQFKTAVINNSPTQQIPQYGVIWKAGDEGGDFIFIRRDDS